MKFLFNLFLGITFGLGLILSEVFKPTTIIAFLSWNENWNPSFLYTIFGMTLTGAIFLIFNNKSNPSTKAFLNNSQQTRLSPKVVIGSILFGVGWSVSGFCVSTATLNLAFGEWQGVLFFIFMMFGFYCPQFFKRIIL
jgi:uncharacterized membrane protein YedE/YeeE